MFISELLILIFPADTFKMKKLYSPSSGIVMGNVVDPIKIRGFDTIV